MLQVGNQISEASDASYFTTIDATGIYNSLPQPSNDNGPSGWGAPSPDYLQATSGILQIKMPDPITLLPQKDYYIIPSSGLNYIDIWTTVATRQPNVIKTPFQVNASDIGIGNTFPMGIYEFLISYRGSWGVTVYKWKMRMAFIAQACCCVKELQARIECGACEGDQIDDYIRGEIALAAIQADMGCLKQNQTAEAIMRLKDICRRNKCGCGC